MSIDKPKLDRGVLKSHGVTYVEEIFPEHRPVDTASSAVGLKLPDHVDCFRQGLLDFGIRFPESSKNEFEAEYENHPVIASPRGKPSDNKARSILPPASAYFRVSHITRESESQTATARTRIDENGEVAKEARTHTKDNVSKAEWVAFTRTNFFMPFQKALPSASEYDCLFDQWALEANIHWNEAQKFANFDPTITRPTGPKPDFTYGFPITKTDDSLPIGFRQEECVENFSLEVLARLRSKDVTSAPQSGLHNWAKKMKGDMNKSDLICFPWAVVELKPAKVPRNEIEFCYCQAANGASAALKIYENLSRHATGEIDRRIPPVVAFTCIGPEVKVWLAYSCTEQNQSNCHKMVCIWGSTFNCTWGVIATRVIIQHMHFWASRILKPKISNWISQIRFSGLSLNDPAENVPVQDVAPQTTRIFDTSGNTVAAAPTPSEDASIPDVRVRSTRAPDAPDAPEDKPAIESSPQITPIQDTIASILPTSETPAQEIPGQETRAQDTPAQEPPAQKTPTPGTPAQELPTSSTSPQDTPTPDTPKREILMPKTRIKTQIIPSKAMPSTISRYNIGIEDITSPILQSNFLWKPEQFAETSLGRNLFLQPLPLDFTKAQKRTIEQGAGPSLSLASLSLVPSTAQNGVTMMEFVGRSANAASQDKRDMPKLHKLLTNTDLEINAGPSGSTEAIDDMNNKEEPTKRANNPEAGRTIDLDEDSLARFVDENDSAHSDEDGDIASLPEQYHYHRYRLRDHLTRRINIVVGSDSGHNDFDDRSYIPSESGSDDSGDSDGRLSQSSENESWETCSEDDNDSIILDKDTRDWQWRALAGLWGPEFVLLDVVVSVIENLSGASLLDTTWRALERWQVSHGHVRSGDALFKEILQQLSGVLELPDDCLITYSQVLAGEKWELIGQALQILLVSGNDKVRSLLSKALQCWNGETNLEILSPELEGLSHGEWANMEKQALEIVQASTRLSDLDDLIAAAEDV